MATTFELSCSSTTFWYATALQHAEGVGYIWELKILLDLHQDSSFCRAERMLLLNRLTSQSFFIVYAKK